MAYNIFGDFDRFGFFFAGHFGCVVHVDGSRDHKAVLPHVRPVLVSRIPLRVCTSHVTACILVGHKEYEQ